MWRALSGAGAARWPRARCVRYRRRSVPVLGAVIGCVKAWVVDTTPGTERHIALFGRGRVLMQHKAVSGCSRGSRLGWGTQICQLHVAGVIRHSGGQRCRWQAEATAGGCAWSQLVHALPGGFKRCWRLNSRPLAARCPLSMAIAPPVAQGRAHAGLQ